MGYGFKYVSWEDTGEEEQRGWLFALGVSHLSLVCLTGVFAFQEDWHWPRCSSSMWNTWCSLASQHCSCVWMDSTRRPSLAAWAPCLVSRACGGQCHGSWKSFQGTPWEGPWPGQLLKAWLSSFLSPSVKLHLAVQFLLTAKRMGYLCPLGFSRLSSS